MPDVIAMATAPHTSTRSASAASVTTTHTTTRMPDGVTPTASTGRTAPSENESAGRPCRLPRLGAAPLLQPQLIARVGTQRVVLGEGDRNLASQRGRQPAALVDARQLALLALRVRADLARLELEVRPLGVAL